MASTYSTSLRIQLIGTGDQSGVWGTTTNTNLGTLIEQAITGVQSITLSGSTYTLTSFNGITDEARNAVLVCTGTLSANCTIIAPAANKTYIVSNNTSGGQNVTMSIGSGSTIVIPNGQTYIVYTDGTNFYAATTGTYSPAFTGTPTAPTATAGTNTTQIATTAFVTTAVANSQSTAAITGGTISGVTITGSTISGTNVSANNITNSGGWSVTPSGTTLYFNYNGTNVAKLDSSGNLTAKAAVTAYGTV